MKLACILVRMKARVGLSMRKLVSPETLAEDSATRTTGATTVRACAAVAVALTRTSVAVG